jgi:catechol 2,3-dioxygenase-like lactoylglutathione lyase family enzyme
MSSLALSSEPAAPVAATVPGHTGLVVGDLGRSVPFYRDAFALTLMGEGEAPGTRFAFLGDGDRVSLTDGLRLEIYAAGGIEGRAPVDGAPSCGFF